MALCVFNCGREARKNGIDCRTCYNRQIKRKSREKAREEGISEEKPILMSPEDLGYAMDKQAYKQWFDDNY